MRYATAKVMASDRSIYFHDPECPAYGIPKWAHVTKCGPCDWLNNHRETESDMTNAWPWLTVVAFLALMGLVGYIETMP